MALGKDNTSIRVQGGGTLYLKELPSGSLDDIGYLQESEIEHSVDSILVNDERGEQVGDYDGNETVVFRTTLLQTKADELNLIRNSSGKTYQGFYKVEFEDGNWQAWTLGASAKIRRNLRTRFAANTPGVLPLELVLYKGASTEKYYDYQASGTEPTLEAHFPTVN